MSIFNHIARLILTAMLGVLLVGFGACGAMGLFGGASGLAGHTGTGGALFVLTLGVIGLGIAWVAGVAIYRLWRQKPPFER